MDQEMRAALRRYFEEVARGAAQVLQALEEKNAINDIYLKALLNNSEANNQRRADNDALPEETFVSNSDGARAKRVRCQKRSQELPENFGMTAAMHDFATEHGMPLPEHEEQFARFCEHHRARGSRMKDWTLAWYTWARNYTRFGGRGAVRENYVVPDSIRQVMTDRGALRPREKGPGGRRGA